MGKTVQKTVRLEQLYLDDENYRLPESKLKQKQSALLRELWNTHEAQDIAVSVETGGFGNEDPIAVVKLEKPKNHYVVLEGNRRVAALKVLTETSSQKLVGYTPTNKVELPNGKIRVLVFSIRADTWRYIGRRHIKGPKKWDSVSKARFIFDTHENLKVPLDSIADQIGDTDRTATRLYHGYKVLKQAKKEGIFDYELVEKVKFSHLYTAIEKHQVLDFLGTTVDELRIQDEPVPQKRLPQLRKLFSFIYGDKKRKGVVESQNPDLRKLAICLTDPEYVERLDRTRNLNDTLAYVLKKSPEDVDPEDRRALKKLGKHKNKFFEGMSCPIKDDRLETLVYEISEINWTKLPTAASFLMRALLEAIVDHSIHKAGLTEALHAENIQRETDKGRPITSKDSRPNLRTCWEFLTRNKANIFNARAADSLGAVGSDQKLMHFIVHGYVKAHPAEVEKMGTKLRFFFESVLNGSAFMKNDNAKE